MEEKILIKSERYNILKGLIIFVVICVVATVILFASEFFFYQAIIPACAGIIISLIIYAWMHSYELTVTDKRVYGKVAFGKRVDLPVDSLSATATITVLKGISVSSSSGRISFLAIKNSNEIYEILNQLLIERQSKKKDAQINHIEVKSDAPDQLKKFKNLLDDGVITQEEFDAKKKELLGL